MPLREFHSAHQGRHRAVASLYALLKFFLPGCANYACDFAYQGHFADGNPLRGVRQ